MLTKIKRIILRNNLKIIIVAHLHKKLNHINSKGKLKISWLSCNWSGIKIWKHEIIACKFRAGKRRLRKSNRIT